jgi:hypothetical protein
MRMEELHDLCASPNVIRVIKPRRMAWFGYAARMPEWIGTYGVLVGKPEGERPLGMPRRRCDDRIIMYPQEKYWRIVGRGPDGCGLV